MAHQRGTDILWQKSIGSLLRKLRKEQKLSYAELSKRCGISKNQYLFIEQGERTTTLTTFRLILNYYGLSVSEFFTMVEVDLEKNVEADDDVTEK